MRGLVGARGGKRKRGVSEVDHQKRRLIFVDVSWLGEMLVVGDGVEVG